MARLPQYPSLLTHRRSSVLPDELQRLIAELPEKIEQREPIADAVRTLIGMTAAVPPAAIAGAALEIPLLGQFHRRLPLNRHHSRPASPAWVAREALDTTPDLAWLYLFHADGRLREAALHWISGPPPNAFLFAALAYRLNDWAEPVRIAAADCARRVFPGTAPVVVARAALHLLTQRWHWQRWGSEAAVLDTALLRPDVLDQIAAIFRSEPAGALSRTMREALRSPHMDPYLPDLLKTAAQPALRAIALQSLVERRATWPAGFRQEWVDGSLGRSRRVPAFEARPIEHSVPLAALLSDGAADRSAAVRKIAADALIAQPEALAGQQDVVGRLLSDPSQAVRERMDFYMRRARGEVAWTVAPAAKTP